MQSDFVPSRPLRRRRAFHIAALLVIAALVFAALSFFPYGKTPSAHADTWTQVFNEDFNGAAGSGLDTNVWKYDTGTGWGTGEIENMTSSTSNVSLDGNGHLAITPRRDGSGNWTSGRIETVQDNFAAPAGGQLKITASLQQPNVSGAAALGYWPAFWTLGTAFRTDHNWPHDGEVDIMEDVNGLSSVYGTLHCGVSPGGPCNETTGIGSGQRACSGCQTGYHTYTEIIDRSVSPEQIRWYLDGVNYFTVNASQVDAATWSSAVDHGFFIIFDLAIGGGFPNGVSGMNTPTGSTQPDVPMLVDNVQVYTSGGSAPTPTPVPPTPTPVPPTPTPGGGGCSGSNFTQGAQSVNSSTDLFWFQPCNWTAGYVILHYTVAGGTQQNVNMSYNSGTGRWEYSVGGLSQGQSIQYSFTYQQNGLQYDTGNYSTTTGSGCTSGSFSEGAQSTGSSTAQAWFQPCNWTAGYVILHYTVAGGTQQNVNMSYNSGTSRWEYTMGGFSPGQTVQYSFTYQQNGLQYDTGSYSWTHP